MPNSAGPGSSNFAGLPENSSETGSRVELTGNHYLASEEWGGVAVSLAEKGNGEPPKWVGAEALAPLQFVDAPSVGLERGRCGV